MNLPQDVVSDINRFKAILGDKLVSVSVFGSTCTKPFEEANDIDLALFVADVDVESVRDQIMTEKFNYPVDGKSINGTYKKPEVIIDKGQKHYDLVVLNHQNPNEKFMFMNKGKLIDIEI